ncbi:MAG: cytochrome c oxidase subunit II [Chthoniobacterales bacterium]
MQSALDPAGSQAAHISQQWWFYFTVLTAVFVLVAIFLFFAISHRRPPQGEASLEQLLPRDPTADARKSRFVIGCVIASVVILFILLFSDVLTGTAVYALSSDPNALIIKVTGHQWWWEVQYDDREPANIVTTANEVHVPTGRTVKIDLRSVDVIHSFWVPNLHGKKDLIPGHPTSTWLKADRPGKYRGQCAEFCGHQHAHMRLDFVVESPEEFQAWVASQRANAPAPSTPSQQHGQQVFLQSQCMTCHSIQGTNARASAGPDLTHFGSRTLLAAGALLNTPRDLADWISNPQNIKPGVRMPANQFNSDDLNALVDYLESLK